jgi:hypothetical protein
MDLYALAQNAAGLAKDVFVSLRQILKSPEMGKAAARAEQAAAGVIAAGQDVARASRAAQQIYEELATQIKAYKVLNRKTQAFNRKVREIVGLKLSDREYVGIRLDAQHIVEARWYAKFPKDFEKAFGWKSAEEMEAIALHTEWHIRSGEKLSTNLNLRGAEREPSLTKALQDYLQNAQTAPDGALKPFTNLKEVFKAHEAFYKSYSPRLWPRLEPWFNDSMAKLAVLNSP